VSLIFAAMKRRNFSFFLTIPSKMNSPLLMKTRSVRSLTAKSTLGMKDLPQPSRESGDLGGDLGRTRHERSGMQHDEGSTGVPNHAPLSGNTTPPAPSVTLRSPPDKNGSSTSRMSTTLDKGRRSKVHSTFTRGYVERGP